MTSIRFVSALEAAPWGAAEELWQKTALEIAGRGHRVTASVRRWPDRPGPVAELIAAGIAVEERASRLGSTYRQSDADLIVLQQPDVFAAVAWMTACRRACRPYVILTHYGALHEWPGDDIVFDLRDGYRDALRCYFVSEASADLVERQTAQTLQNRAVVRAPYRVPFEPARPWPADDGTLRLACVGRLDAEDKGQDSLIHIMAQEKWRSRPLRLSLYGTGPHAGLFRAMIDHLGVESVTLRGHVEDVGAIWDDHHALVLASRAEGLPAVIVEAMLSGRPAVVTDVAGNKELLREGETGFVARTPYDADIDAALERTWQGRADLRAMGAAAARAIRTQVPPDPAGVFADELLGLT